MYIQPSVEDEWKMLRWMADKFMWVLSDGEQRLISAD